MKTLLLCAGIMVGQMMTLQDRPVVHLAPNSHSIPTEFGGRLLELINAPSTVSLPKDPPERDSTGEPWSIDLRNLGPVTVRVAGKHFSVSVSVGRTVHVLWDGSMYAIR